MDSVADAGARVGMYLGRLVVPLHPTAALAIPETDALSAGVGWLGLLCCALLTVWAVRTHQAWAGPIGLVWLPLLPVSGLLAAPVRYSEGFLVWPLVGVAALLGTLRGGPWIAAVALPFLITSSWNRVPDWSSDLALWVPAGRRLGPDPILAAKAAQSLKDIDPERALNGLGIALASETDPRRRRESHALSARILIDRGQEQEALPHLRMAAVPTDPEAGWALGARCVLESSGSPLALTVELPAMRDVCEAAARRQPDAPHVLNAAGVEAGRRGDTVAAASYFARAVELAPDVTAFERNLAAAEAALKK